MIIGMNRMFLLFAVFLLLPLQVCAHASGESFEKSTGLHLVDIGFDTPLSLTGDTLLDLSLTPTTGEPMHYTSIVVTLESGALVQWRKTVVNPEFGKAITSVLPERSGHWYLRAVFMNEEVVVADASFPVDIPSASTEGSSHWRRSASVVSLVVLVLVVYGVISRRRH